MSNHNFSQPAATRDGFGQGLIEVAQKNKQVVGLCADLTGSMRMRKFEQQFPDRFIQVGVAEQNLIGVAAGLALGGKIPFAASFAVFSPGRSWDQIRVSVAYSNLNVKIIGGHAGIITGPDGATHQALEDIALMRSLPNMKVIVPADAEQAHQAVHALAADTSPAYLRLSRPKLPVITHSNNFTIGKAQVLKQGVDATIIACGEMVAEALEAAKQLLNKGKSIRVINMHTIKPLDTQVVINAANETGIIITAEDHQVHGGLGSAVAEVLAQEQSKSIQRPVKFKIIGVKDEFGESGEPTELLEKYGLTTQAIKKEVLANLKN
jgi:transketolase